MQNVLMGMLLVISLAACQASDDSAADAPSGYAALPPGDPARGAEIYDEALNGGLPCVQCHVLDGENAGVGPTLLGYADVAGERVAGQSAEDYTYNAIVRPALHITPGYANLMPTNYRSTLEDQDLADLIAYLLTLEGEDG